MTPVHSILYIITIPVEKVKNGYDGNSIKTLERVYKHYYFIIRVKVNNEQLAEALKRLPEKKLDILLMFYFLEMSDAEIADLLQIDRTTSFRNRRKSLEEIKKILQEDKL